MQNCRYSIVLQFRLASSGSWVYTGIFPLPWDIFKKETLARGIFKEEWLSHCTNKLIVRRKKIFSEQVVAAQGPTTWFCVGASYFAWFKYLFFHRILLNTFSEVMKLCYLPVYLTNHTITMYMSRSYATVVRHNMNDTNMDTNNPEFETLRSTWLHQIAAFSHMQHVKGNISGHPQSGPRWSSTRRQTDWRSVVTWLWRPQLRHMNEYQRTETYAKFTHYLKFRTKN